MSAMNVPLINAIQDRRSVRGFTQQPVPRKTIEDILSLAQQSPSNCNVQPWRVLMANGEQCNILRQELKQAFLSGAAMNPDFSALPKFEGAMRERQMDCAFALYGAMGIERSDREGRLQATARNYEFFDAPHVLFITMQRDFSPSIAVDVGMYAQTLMLLMNAHGIASCAQASVAYYPDIVRDFFDEPKESGILFGISFGYEDTAIAANKAKTQRADLTEVVKIKG